MNNLQHIEAFGLFLGLLLSIGMFAVKAAVGGWHCISLYNRRWLLPILLLPYLLLFEGSFWLLRTIGLARISEFSLRYFGYGVALHLMMCVGLAVWGYRLLVRPCGHCASQGDRSWLLLAMPCPVCASAVLLSCIMAQLLLPEASGHLRYVLPMAFLLMYFGMLAALRLVQRITGAAALHVAGWMMLLLAAYFVLLLLMSPQWTQLDRIHAVASHSLPPAVTGISLLWMIAVFCVVFLAGFLKMPLSRK